MSSYTVEIKKAHLEWGSHRYTSSRGTVYGEGYIAIPAVEARRFEIFNSKNYNGDDELGGNLFHCVSTDGNFSGTLKAQGNTKAGNIFAKQFAENDNLKGIGDWYYECEAEEGDFVEVTFISDTEIKITLIKS